MSKRDRHSKKKVPEPISEDEAKSMSKQAWMQAIARAAEEDRWCDNCGSPLWYIEEEDKEFCMTCWAVQNGIEIAKQEFEVKLYNTVKAIQQGNK